MAEQSSLDAARGAELKAHGLETLEAFDGQFVQYMRKVARQISERCGFVSSDNLRVVAAELGIEPTHRNSWGAVFHGPRWRMVGRQVSAIPSNHHREIKVWQWQGGTS